ncbi:heat-inducible transcriptional repressor HrcA [Lentibacillus amyloliquefaciens]|uniref:Heat-inducible transcription repressor HrcA n=1 Tax=Lentibacillus amyloliquefaciens TaxID=1472767 RepID=A0A0U4F5Q5_9BACI|nr:heat-inducible transcriptional repressor HrcA [Lentibacillus amyloliquefaciens]ALX48131.1 heat-inducible transcriptional repressor HrcA [Lentibacillus amyloliquefaciens]
MLTERQLLVLQVIIDDFIESAQPVGSRSIAKKDNIMHSSATVRNEMADLEEMGFLEKTHSSSGRIPSEKGYRYYVDNLVTPQDVESNVRIIRSIMQEGLFEFEQIVQSSAEILSEITNYTSIILGPEVFETKLKQLQIISLTPHTAVAILVTNTGHVEHRSFSVPDEINASDLEKMVNILNDRLYGVPIFKLHEKLNTEIVSLLDKYVTDSETSYDYLKGAFFSENPVKLYFGGKTNLLMQPEFNDIDKVRSFYAMIEEKDEIAKLLKDASDGIKVSIGHENKVDAIKDCSLITATYDLNREHFGTIALIGPTRMEYKKVIALLNALSTEMTNVLYEWY